jgi:hypothetical protein
MELFVGIGQALNDIIRIAIDILLRWMPSIATVVIGFGGQNVRNQDIFGTIQAPVPEPAAVDTFQLLSQDGTYAQLAHWWGVYVAIALFISLIEAAIIVYSFLQTRRIRIKERDARRAAIHSVVAHDVSKTQLRWNRVLEQSESEDEHLWRLAILEADIMLNELLDTLGYKGETMSEKMRAVPRSAFNTIDQAWEAHKVRNEVAHGGEAYGLSARDVRTAIQRYESVFREHHVIE